MKPIVLSSIDLSVYKNEFKILKKKSKFLLAKNYSEIKNKIKNADIYVAYAKFIFDKSIIDQANKLKFVIPYNEKYPQFLEDNWGDKVELIKTPVEFKKTIEVLTEDLENDEWIFWASDDVYPIELNSEKADVVVDCIENVDDDAILSISFTKWEDDFYNTYEDQIQYKDLKFVRRKSIKYQWQHHFWRVGVLKIMFECLDEPKVAKDMDHMQKEEKSKRFFNLINEGKWYMLDHNIGIFGESTAREVNMLLNCISLYKNIKILSY